MQAERELLRTRQELKALKEEYDDFVYVVSHDLGAPLRQVEGLAQLIATRNAGAFDEKTMQHFALIADSIEQGKAMILLLLEFSRLQRDSAGLEPVDCNAVVDAVRDVLAGYIIPAQAEVTSAELPMVMGDKNQLMLLFSHLLKNALMFQPHDHVPKVHISAVAKDDDQWKFTVQDNGIGMADYQMDKIFQVLRRGVTDDEYPGNGMGLAIARKITHWHHGELWAESAPGKGSSFYFTLPRKVA